MSEDERVLIYLGPTLSKDEAIRLVPDAIIRPPAKQSDIISDIVQLEPTHLILIDGEFSQNLSVWIKEIIYALLLPSARPKAFESRRGLCRCMRFPSIRSGTIYPF